MCIGFGAAAVEVSAQSSEFADARSMGMARGSMVSARGIDAIGLNPANLGTADRSTFSISIIPFGLHFGTNFVTWGDFRKYFSGTQSGSGKTGTYLTDADKTDILNNFPGNTGKASAGGAVTLFAMTFIDETLGGFAFTVNERFGMSAVIPSDYLRIAFYGNPIGSKYEFSGTKFNAEWMREYALHYGRRLPISLPHTTISAGISLKLLHGFAYAGIDEFSASVSTDSNSTLKAGARFLGRSSTIDAFDDTTHPNIAVFPAPAGVGFGIDVGATAQIGNAFRVGMSVVDIGGLTWRRNAYENRTDANVTLSDLTSQSQRDSVTNTFKSQRDTVGSFRTSLPTVFRFGVAVDVRQLPFMKAMPGQMAVELDYIQGLNSLVGNTTSPRFALGIDYHILEWLPVRTGLAFGGNERVHWGMGAGLNFSGFDLEVGTEDIIAIFAPDHMSTVSAAFGMRLRF